MSTIPNLTIIPDDLTSYSSLSRLRTEMLNAPTDYVMVTGALDTVEITQDLTDDVHWLPTFLRTKRTTHQGRPVIPYDPVLMLQFNYAGSPIFRKELALGFPEASVEPFHAMLVRAVTAGKTFSLATGKHEIMNQWPLLAPSGAYGRFTTSFDPVAIEEAIPGLTVSEINHRPFFKLRDTRHGRIEGLTRGCSMAFLESLAGYNVTVRQVSDISNDLITSSEADYIAWFDGIQEAVDTNTLNHLAAALEFPGVVAACPRLISDFSVQTYHLLPYGLKSGIYQGFSPRAWMIRQSHEVIPVTGYTSSHAILRPVA